MAGRVIIRIHGCPFLKKQRERNFSFSDWACNLDRQLLSRLQMHIYVSHASNSVCEQPDSRNTSKSGSSFSFCPCPSPPPHHPSSFSPFLSSSSSVLHSADACERCSFTDEPTFLLGVLDTCPPYLYFNTILHGHYV